jgi:glutathione S-transferase
VGLVFQEAFAEKRDPARLEEARRLLHAAADRVEKTVARQPYLAGQTLTAADLFVAPWIACGRMPVAVAEVFPPARIFVDEFKLEGHDKTVEWLGRVMAHDPAK